MKFKIFPLFFIIYSYSGYCTPSFISSEGIKSNMKNSTGRFSGPLISIFIITMKQRQIAEIGAAYAEEAYDELKVKFNHLVSRKNSSHFYNTSIHFQQTIQRPDLYLKE
jgi:hypothetical protein